MVESCGTCSEGVQTLQELLLVRGCAVCSSVLPSKARPLLLENKACCVLLPKHANELKRTLRSNSTTTLRFKALTATLKDLLENVDRSQLTEDRNRLCLCNLLEDCSISGNSCPVPPPSYADPSPPSYAPFPHHHPPSYGNADMSRRTYMTSDPITSTINLPAAAAPAAAAAHAHKSFNDPTLSNTELTPGLGPTSYLSNFCCPETAFSSCNLTAQPPTHQQQVPTRLSSRTFPTSHPSLPPPPPPSPLTLVLTSTDLTHSILSFLLTSAQPETARNQLAALSLLSRRWRTLTSWDRYWKPVAVGLLPVLGVNNPEAKAAGWVEEDYRNYLLKYGRCLLDRRAWMGEALEEGYLLGFEVWDAADGLRMLSASGPIRVQIDQAGGFTSLRIGGSERREVRGAAFSAASRDPELRRFNNMEDYFSRGHLPDFPSALSVRVTVTDERTGRMALLWSTRKDSAYLTEAPLAYWEPFLLDNSISVFLDHWAPLMSRAYDGESMTVTIGFHVCPEPGQEEVPEQHRLYRLAGGDMERYEDHQSYISITFMTLNTNGIHSFFRALFKDD